MEREVSESTSRMGNQLFKWRLITQSFYSESEWLEIFGF